MSLAVKEILNIGKRRLEESQIADAAIDCKTLYCFLMNITSTHLILEYQRILPDSLCDEYFALLDKRCSGIPLQYITGTQAFMGLEFDVNETVLIPRQDTETMVEDTIEIIKKGTLRSEAFPIKKKKELEVLDLCCGSGAIGISLARLCENVKVTCADKSLEALDMARKNAEKLGTSKKMDFESGDLFKPFHGHFKNKKFDLIISNPPYIKTEVIETLQREVKDHEPMMALDGGADGLEFYQRIIAQGGDHLKKEGVLILEIGHDQRTAVLELLETHGGYGNCVCLQDLALRDRIVIATWAGKKK